MQNNDNYTKPPRLADWLLKRFAPAGTLEEVQGDLLELYHYWIETDGLQAARQRYTWTVLRLLRPFSRKNLPETNQYHSSHSFYTGMIKNSFNIALRNFAKNKSYALINLSGLTLGLTVSMFIFLFVRNELSYDEYLPGYDHVVRIQPTVTSRNGEQTWATSEGFLVPTVTSLYPEVEAATRILRNDNEVEFKIGSKQFSELGAIAVDSSFFKVFPFPFIYGDRNTALDKPDGVVISGEVSRRLFGDVDPVGEIIMKDGAAVVITGVFEDVPDNSHFNFKIVVPLKSFWPDVDQSRNMYAFYSYVRVKSAAQVKPLSEKLLNDWYAIYGYLDEKGVPDPPESFKTELGLMPLSAIHLTSKAEKEFGVNGSLQVVYIFIGVACLILIIVVINYVNLSNAMALKRSREVAIRKTIGASRGKLFLNFILESYGFSLLAFALSFVMMMLLMPFFNTLTGKQFDIHVLLNYQTLVPAFVLWIALGFLSGFYPAIILSSFNPMQVLKSGIGTSKSGVVSLLLRRGLLVFQFTISALLIVAAFAIQHQMDFIETMNIGLNKDNVVIVPVKGDVYQKREALKNEMNKLKGVERSTYASVAPGKRVVFLTVRIPDLAGSRSGNDDGTRDMRVMAVDHDFIKTLQLEVIEGRDFSIDNPSDIQSAFLLNEAAVKEFNLDDPIGKPFEYRFGEPKTGHIIGVVRDFNFASVHTKVEPLMLHILPWYSTLCIRLNTDASSESIENIEEVWKSISSSPFDYYFLDASYDALYKAEKTTSQLITYLTILALAFACLGLFGVVSFFIEYRTREVGIRKVFGASVFSLLQELSKEYMLVVIAGNIFALYPAWFLVNQWLQKFAYRVELSVLPFIVAFLVSVVLAYCSILRVVIKTARINPAVILKNE
ncbi:MAG: ABC transporter permease [Cyclobacteriaceae bacterium]|nr:ABC transporter permease [Cyclobacteriaceae bacterium]